MGPAAPFIAAAAFAVTAIQTKEQISAAQDQAREAKRARRARQRLAEVRAARQRRAAIREAQIRQAQIQNQGANIGTRATSGQAGAVASVRSQLANNLSFLDTNQRFGQAISIFDQRAADAQSRQATAAAIGNLSSSIFELSGGFDNFTSE